MHEENFLSSWLREDVEGLKAEMQRLNEEAEQEESNRGEREVEREGERVEIKRRYWKPVSSDFVEDFSSMTEWESEGIPWGGVDVCV